MNDTMLIEVTNRKAIGLLHELEESNLVKVIEKNMAPVTTSFLINIEELSANNQVKT